MKLNISDGLQLRNAYAAFWAKVVRNAGGRARPRPQDQFPFAVDADGCVVVETLGESGALEFRGLPARPRDSRADYDIYVQFRERIRGVDDGAQGLRYVAVESNVRVQYLESRSGADIQKELSGEIDPARAYQGVHFDMSSVGLQHHPIFHAQFDLGCITGADIGRKYSPPADEVVRCDNPRIPTAPLDLAGTVYVILHDHLPDVVTKGWPRDFHEAVERLPALPLESFSTYLRPGATMECAWWYLHGGHHES